MSNLNEVIIKPCIVCGQPRFFDGVDGLAAKCESCHQWRAVTRSRMKRGEHHTALQRLVRVYGVVAVQAAIERAGIGKQ